MHKKIGQGFYYNVYDIGNGRVRKEVSSYRSRVRKLLAWLGTDELGVWNAVSPKRHRAELSASIERSKEVISVFGSEYLGNPVFVGQFEYEQDKAVTIEDYMTSHDEEASLILIEQYIMLLYMLWSKGFGDIVYNFTINCGVSEKTEKLILFDFNELTRDRNSVAESIRRKKWLTQHSLRDFPKGLSDLKTKIISMFERCLTQTELDKRWPVV